MTGREFIEPEQNKAGNQLEGTGLTITALIPLSDSIQAQSFPDIIPGSGQAGLQGVSESSLDQQAVHVAQRTAAKVLAVLADGSDPERGSKALALTDTASEKEFMLSGVDPYALTNPSTEPGSYLAYSGTLSGLLTAGGAYSNPAFVGVAQGVKSGDLPGAVKTYDHRVGTFL